MNIMSFSLMIDWENYDKMFIYSSRGFDNMLKKFIMDEEKEDGQDLISISFKHAFRVKLFLLFSDILQIQNDTDIEISKQENIFYHIFKTIIPDLFFEDNGMLRMDIVKYILFDKFNIVVAPEDDKAEEIIVEKFNQWNALAVCALLYNNSICIDVINREYFNSAGKSNMTFMKDGNVTEYTGYYDTLMTAHNLKRGIGKVKIDAINKSYRIPVKTNTIAYQLYTYGQRECAAGYDGEVAKQNIIDLILKPITQYYINNAVDVDTDTDFASDEFQEKFFVYLFGESYKVGKNPETPEDPKKPLIIGKLNPEIAPEINEMDLSQVTLGKPRTSKSYNYMSYSIAEIGEILANYVGKVHGTETIEFDKVKMRIDQWKTMVFTIEIPGRPKIENGFVAVIDSATNYDGKTIFPDGDPNEYTLNDIYKKILKEVALDNPFNRQVARYSLLSKQLAVWFSVFGELVSDILKANDITLTPPRVDAKSVAWGGKKTYKKRKGGKSSKKHTTRRSKKL